MSFCLVCILRPLFLNHSVYAAVPIIILDLGVMFDENLDIANLYIVISKQWYGGLYIYIYIYIYIPFKPNKKIIAGQTLTLTKWYVGNDNATEKQTTQERIITLQN